MCSNGSSCLIINHDGMGRSEWYWYIGMGDDVYECEIICLKCMCRRKREREREREDGENYGSVDVITRVEDDCVVGRATLRFSIMPVALHCISSQLRGESEQPRTSRIAPGDARPMPVREVVFPHEDARRSAWLRP